MTPQGSASTLAAAYRGRRVLLVGGTGFLGSVTVSLLLQQLPELERLYLVLRRRPGLTAERRFHERILPGVPFEPLRQRFGVDGFAALLEEKVRVLEGDLSDPMLGIGEEELARLDGELDLVINCSGLVDFHAPLERAFRVNVLGTRHLIELCERTGAALVHTSTAFVAGRTRGRVAEQVEVGYFPRRAESPYVRFEVEREIADLQEELEAIQTGARSQRAQATYTEQAITRYREINDGFPSRAQLDNAIRRAARDHLSAEGVEAGRRRAEFWGWPNVYTYSKAIGEQLIASSGVRGAIVRPTVIESALAYPVAGWNQNATTSAPLVMLALAGFALLPGTADHVIDMIPVDQVAWAILAVGAACAAGSNQRVYQVGTSDSNPLDMRRLTDLVGLYTHSRALDEGDDGSLTRLWKGNRELRLVGEEEFRKRARLIESFSRRVLRDSARLRDRARHRRLREMLSRLADRAESFGSEMEKAVALWDVFLPFSHDLDYRFDTGNIRSLAEALGSGEDPVRFAPAEIDWRRYWLEIHIPGLRRWVLSETAQTRALRTVSAAIPFSDRVESLAARDGYRRALGYGVGERPISLTYGELWSAAGSLGGALRARELPQGASVGVVAGAGEPWPIALLAALREGLPVTVVPADAWNDPAADLAGSGMALCIRMRRRDHAEVRATRRGEATAIDVLGTVGSMPNAQGVSTSARSRSVGFMSRGEEGWEVRRRLEGNALSRELAELGATLALDEDARAVLPVPGSTEEESAPLALITLALLYHGVRCEVVAAPEVADVAREIASTVVVLSRECRGVLTSAEGLASVGTVRRVVSLCPATADEVLAPLNRGGSRVVRLDWDHPSGTAAAHLLPAGDDSASTAVSRRAGSEELVRIGAVTNPRPHLFGGVPVLSSRLLRNGRSGGRVLVVPDLEGVTDLQELRERLFREVGRYNSAVELSGRVSAVGISLIPREVLAEEAESHPGVVWLSTRRRDAIEEDPDELLRQGLVLFGALYDANELEFFVRQLLAEPLTMERLRIWEGILLRGAREGGMAAQVFLQSFELEGQRRRHPATRVARRAGAVVRHVRDWSRAEDPEGRLLPEPVSAMVRAGIGGALSALFRYGLRTSVYGAAYVPAGENFLVVANHSSHLDAGLVQHAIGPWRHRLHTLAAKDYFFSTPGRRFIAHHFTRLIPTDRQRVSSDWLRRARDLLATGECVLIFPEGTRAEGSEVRAFKASVGTLVRAAGVPVLPIYVEGSDRVLPKGKAIPRGREVAVHVGPPLSAGFLAAATEGIPGLKQDRAIAALLQRAVASVPRRDFWWLRGELPPADPLLLHGSAPEGVEEEFAG